MLKQNENIKLCSGTDGKPLVVCFFLWSADLACDKLQHNKHFRHISGTQAFINAAANKSIFIKRNK